MGHPLSGSLMQTPQRERLGQLSQPWFN